jgi:hypothetical protein
MRSRPPLRRSLGGTKEFQTLDLTPQNKTLVTHFRRAGRITQRQAIMDYSIQSLTKRMAELRQMGLDVQSNFKNHPVTGQRYCEYLSDGRTKRQPSYT